MLVIRCHSHVLTTGTDLATLSRACLGFRRQPQTLLFKEFIDFWLDMIKLASKAADTHSAYLEASMRQDIERMSRRLRGYRSMHPLRLTVGFRNPPDEGFVHQST